MKTGSWETVMAELEKLPSKAEELKRLVLEETPAAFEVGIVSEIKKNKVHPVNNEFSTEEYTQKIKKLVIGSNKVFIGIQKNELVRGIDVGQFAVEAEYGIHGVPFLGIWRRFKARFDLRMQARLLEISSEKK